ncbi:hypothetical protein A2415_00630 [candidate division WWE3 bacterium RIFOXYC1_FULL_39_7]|uniref:Flippase-like domain-containing protein n=2 Tax=Katanobacteria TaxID=422282 RepID=A0A1F4X6U6_UNCKA|nr:MAG: hypothetical protein A2415_00630 [candidate division WWE3 bacterium RIFOXYC1_FULL_39_7]OGC77349.1 MAG: hypothetical protein A2619_04925 [candidate division WWE3 bacterium RIFOXYD1_FULL_39_9]
MSKKLYLIRYAVLKIFVSVLLLFLVISRLRDGGISDVFRSLDYSLIPFVMICIILNSVFRAYRLRGIVSAKDNEKLDVGFLTKLYLASAFYNIQKLFTKSPENVLDQIGNKLKSEAAAKLAISVEKLFDHIILFTILGIGIGYKVHSWVLLVFAWVIAGAYLLVWFSKSTASLQKIFSYFAHYKNKKGVFVQTVFLSVLIQLVNVVIQFVLFTSLGYTIPIFFAFASISLITLVVGHIPSLNGLGVQALLNVALYSLIGIPMEVSFVAALLYHVTGFLISLLSVIIFKGKRSK